MIVCRHSWTSVCQSWQSFWGPPDVTIAFKRSSLVPEMQKSVLLEKQLSNTETLLQNVCQERFQLLDEKENLTEDNKHFVEMFTEVKKMLESKFR